MQKNNYTVYTHVFPNGKVYVGITKQKTNNRWQNGDGYKNQPVYNAILHFGWENIEHNIIKSNISREEAQETEKELIELHNSIQDGYNVAAGGGCGGNSWVKLSYNNTLYSPEELASISKIKDITYHDITTRVNHHKWSVDKALNTPKFPKNKKYFYDGDEYTAKELYDIRLNKDLSVKNIRSRLSKGWSVEKAISFPIGKKEQPCGSGEKRYFYNNQWLNSYELWCLRKTDDLTVGDITNRINHHKWCIEDAISKPKKQRNKKIIYNGIEYSSKELAKLSPHSNITHHTITDRLRSGWSVEKAINTPIK